MSNSTWLASLLTELTDMNCDPIADLYQCRKEMVVIEGCSAEFQAYMVLGVRCTCTQENT